jgi:hypothetical protein
MERDQYESIYGNGHSSFANQGVHRIFQLVTQSDLVVGPYKVLTMKVNGFEYNALFDPDA